MTYLIFQSNPWLLPALMLVVLGLSIEIPYRCGPLLARYIPKNTDPFNAIQAGILTLSAFVLALSFNQASARFDTRRALVVKEADAIGTAWLRANQLGSIESRRFRKILTDYTATRLRAYETPGNPVLYKETIDRGDKDQNGLWAIASSALRAHQSNLGISLLVQSTNDMIDTWLEQLQALTGHVPTAVIVLTLMLVILGTLSLGMRFAIDESRPAVLSAIYVVAYVLVINMMVDYDRPNTGFVRVSVTPLRLQLQSMQRSP
ncbi:MAG: hypothetical protein WB681_13740 [Candidatus Cybelea sp.]